MFKINPFNSEETKELEEECKDEDLDEEIDVGLTVHKSVETVITKNHTEMFYQQMNAIQTDRIISSSGLNLVKSFFKYVELLHVLSPYNFEILIGLTQVFEFYVFAVFFLYSNESDQIKLFDDTLHSKISEFSSEGHGNKNFQAKLSQIYELSLFQKKYSTLKSEIIRIKDWIESQVSSKDDHYDVSGRKLLEKIFDDNSIFDIMDTKQNYELFSESIVAVESIFFIYECLYKLKEKIMKGVNTEHKSYVVQFFNQSELIIKELRQFIYEDNWTKIMKMEPIVELVKSTDWNTDSFESSNSPYVERLLYQINQWENKIISFGGGAIPKYVINIILYNLIQVISRHILTGFSEVKKCTETGRKAMERDVKSLKSDLSSLIETDLKCFDDILDYLQQFYYYPEKILKFVKKHPVSLLLLIK